MSLVTWKKEFYPSTAQAAAERGVVSAVKHSLQKWRGLSEKALKQHGLRLSRDKTSIRMDRTEFTATKADTCALCELFIKNCCRGCPLFEIEGVVCGNTHSAWRHFLATGNNSRMVALLEIAREFVKGQKLKHWIFKGPENQLRYVAAYSLGDAQKLLLEYGIKPPTQDEMKSSWRRGWDRNVKNQVANQRAIWFQSTTHPSVFLKYER